VGYCKALLTIMLGVKVKEHYFLKNNTHVANKRLYFVEGLKTLHRLSDVIIDKKKMFFNKLFVFFMCCNHGLCNVEVICVINCI